MRVYGYNAAGAKGEGPVCVICLGVKSSLSLCLTLQTASQNQ